MAFNDLYGLWIILATGIGLGALLMIAQRTMRRYQKPARSRTATRPKAAAMESDLSPAQQSLYERLRWWRVETARSHNVPAYVIFHDATLREIARAMPMSLEDMRQVSGVGEKKLETYGEQIIALVAEQRAA